MRFLRMTALLAAAIAAASCGGAVGGNDYGTTTPTGPTSGGGTQSSNSITLINTSFNPSSLTVPTGTTVNWVWNDCAVGGYGGTAGCVAHNVTFDDGTGITSAVQDSGSFSRTFATAGTFKYHCSVHGSAMSGQIVVQ